MPQRKVAIHIVSTDMKHKNTRFQLVMEEKYRWEYFVHPSQVLQGTGPNGEKGLLFPPSVPCPLRSISSSPAAPYPNLPLLVHLRLSPSVPRIPTSLLFTSSSQSFPKRSRTKRVIPRPHPCQTTLTEISQRSSQPARPRPAAWLEPGKM